MPRQRLPVQYFADMLDELKSMNAKLDTLIDRSAPQGTPVPAEPSVEPERVRLHEPVRSTSDATIGPPSMVGPPDEGIDGEADAEVSPIREQGRAGTCLEQTKRGNVCGKPLPCRYHD